MAEIFRTPEALRERLSSVRAGRKVVFTNGCFDILHPGHLKILEAAAAAGDILVVGLNSDSSVRELKGPTRPVMDENARAVLLAALKPVDYVAVFPEKTPLQLIKAIRPEILVKGAEYGSGEIVGEKYAEKTLRIDMVSGYSTSEIIWKIKPNG